MNRRAHNLSPQARIGICCKQFAVGFGMLDWPTCFPATFRILKSPSPQHPGQGQSGSINLLVDVHELVLRKAGPGSNFPTPCSDRLPRQSRLGKSNFSFPMVDES